jgi:Leucine-rich repeat (LRR) protein
MPFLLCKLIKWKFLFIMVVLLLLGVHGFSQQNDELNFKVSDGSIGYDTDPSDSIFFSIKEASKHPSRVMELILEGQGLREFPMAILMFKNLRILNISQNRIDSIPIHLFDHCKKISVLQYAGNALSAIPSVLFQSRLKVLDLSENNITHLPDGIAACHQLEELDLHANAITYFPSSSVLLKSLKSLILSGNPIKSMNAWIVNQPKLKILFIDNTFIDQLTDDMCTMKALRFLNMEENSINSFPACFCQLHELKVIMVLGTALSKERMQELNNCLPALHIR